MKNSHYLDKALEASKAAEEVIRYYYDRNVKVTMKEDYTPVTEADVETEKKIKEVLLDAFPEHGFYGEETGKTREDAEFTWLIDPIDGTKSFVRQYPFFSCQIALMQADKVIVGVSNGVMFNELAWASEGEGAFLNDQPIKVSEVSELRDAALSTGNIASLAADGGRWKGLAELAQQVNRTRGYGDFYHYHLLASGKIDLIVESDVNILDVAALSIIVNEAGGKMTDLEGEALTLDTRNVLAANSPDLYDQVYQMIHRP